MVKKDNKTPIIILIIAILFIFSSQPQSQQQSIISLDVASTFDTIPFPTGLDDLIVVPNPNTFLMSIQADCDAMENDCSLLLDPPLEYNQYLYNCVLNANSDCACSIKTCGSTGYCYDGACAYCSDLDDTCSSGDIMRSNCDYIVGPPAACHCDLDSCSGDDFCYIGSGCTDDLCSTIFSDYDSCTFYNRPVCVDDNSGSYSCQSGVTVAEDGGVYFYYCALNVQADFVTCPSGETCDSSTGYCEGGELICNPYYEWCEGDEVWKCSSDGLSESLIGTCQSGYHCEQLDGDSADCMPDVVYYCVSSNNIDCYTSSIDQSNCYDTQTECINNREVWCLTDDKLNCVQRSGDCLSGELSYRGTDSATVESVCRSNIESRCSSLDGGICRVNCFSIEIEVDGTFLDCGQISNCCVPSSCVVSDSCKIATCIGLPCTGPCGNIYDGTKICESVCNNGIVEGTEKCDGTDLDGETCQTLGYDSGTLDCNSLCQFNPTGCVGTPTPTTDCLSNCSVSGKCVLEEGKCVSACAPWDKWKSSEFDGSDPESGCELNITIIVLAFAALIGVKMFRG